MNIEQLSIEQILKTWAKVRREDEESFLMVSVKPKEDSFTVVIWSKPLEMTEEDGEAEEKDDLEGEGEEKDDPDGEERLQIGFHSAEKKIPNGRRSQESKVADYMDPMKVAKPDPLTEVSYPEEEEEDELDEDDAPQMQRTKRTLSVHYFSENNLNATS